MNKLLVLTGGTRGIGFAINNKFAREGFDIITCSRSAKQLDQLNHDFNKKYPGCRLYTLAIDLSHRHEVEKFSELIKSLNRPVDILINNAGVFLPGRITQEPEGNLEILMNINVYSAYYLAREIIPGMIARKAGHIFNLCSTASITPYINGGAYGISKFALYGMTKILRQELKEYHIRVTAVLPGATLTSSWEGTDLPPERFMNSVDVAEAIFSAWSLGRSSVVEEIIIRPQLGDI